MNHRHPSKSAEKRNDHENYQENASTSESPEAATTVRRYNFFFVSDQAAHNMTQFQYRGQDLSLLYHYILSPLASFCVEQFTPRWVAPNVITLTGLLFMASAYLTMWFYSPNLEPSRDDDDERPRWIFLWNAVAMLLYQTLDNMDGKQARRTKSSSPLGLLFDHGIDALNSVFGSVNWMIAMNLHPVDDALLCFIILFGPYMLFFVGTWEEYFTGELIMPIVNGPNEGLLGGVLLSLSSWYWGPSLWQQTTVWEEYVRPNLTSVLPNLLAQTLPTGLRHCDLQVMLSTFLFLQECLSKTSWIVYKYGPRPSLANLAPFGALVGCFLAVGMMVDVTVWTSMPRTSLHLCATLFVEMTTDLMMAHMTGQQYSGGVRWILWPLVGLTIGLTSGLASPGPWTDEYLLVYAAAAAAYLSIKIILVIHEVCVILNIWCFDITTPRLQQQSLSSSVQSCELRHTEKHD